MILKNGNWTSAYGCLKKSPIPGFRLTFLVRSYLEGLAQFGYHTLYWPKTIAKIITCPSIF